MGRPQSPEDELARRRAEKARVSPDDAGDTAAGQEPLQPDWKDVLAMIIAAYQVIIPVVLLFIGAVLAVYLLFRLFFLR